MLVSAVFKNAFNLIEIFGFKIKVDPSWLLIAALIVWVLSSSYFPQNYSGYSGSAYIAMAVVAMLGLFVSVVAHEMAHSLVARMFGLRVGGITLFVFGGVAELEQEPQDPRSEFWIAIAGPIMSVILAGIAYAFVGNLGSEESYRPVAAVFAYLSQINFLLAAFNMVPAFPLDGGRILRAALWHLKEDLVWATRIAAGAGTIFGIFLIFSGIGGLFFNLGIGGFWYILIGFFVVSASRGSYQQVLIKTVMNVHTIESLMTRDPVTISPSDSIADVVDNIMLARNISFLPVVEKEELLGFVNLDAVQKIKRDKWQKTSIGEIYVPRSSQNTIAPDMRAEQVFNHMATSGSRKLLISDGTKLIGVISMADLLSFLSIRMGLKEFTDKPQA